MTMIELRTLGDCQILVGGERLGPQSPHAFALALFLAVERGRPHARDELLAMFFPGVPEGNAAHSLRQTLYKLRQLGVPAETTPAGTMLAAAEVRDDYSALMATGALPDARAARLPGQFLPGYWPRISDEFARWLEGQRDAVGSALRRAYVSRILDRRAVARWDEVERYARACLVVDPLNEEATLALAEALALSGSKAAGVKVLDRYLEEVGREDDRLTLPATVLRKRISERLCHSSVKRADMPMLGRELEVRQMNKLLGAARAGTPQAVYVWGEAGIGKSRLIQEFGAFASIASVRCASGSCKPPDARRPMSVFADLAPQLLQLPGAIGCDPAAIAMVRRLFTLSADDEAVLSATESIKPYSLSEGIISSLSQLLDAITVETTLVLTIEDIHWADDASRHALSVLAAEQNNRRLLIITTSRDLASSELLSIRHVVVMRLQPLTSQDAHTIVEAQFAANGKHGGGLADAAVCLGAGNPFALISLGLHYAENGDSEQVPRHLQQIVAQQLQQLSQGARQSLLAAITLDKYASPHRIRAALQMPVHSVMAHLTELESSGTIILRAGQIELPHSLVVACLVESEPSALNLIQGSVAQVLAEEASDSTDMGLAWLAADLWHRAGLPEKSTQLLRRCAMHAINIGAVTEAVVAASLLRNIAGADSADPVFSEICSYLRRSQHMWRALDATASLPLAPAEGTAYEAELEILRLEISRAITGSAADHVDWFKHVLSGTHRPIPERLRAALSILIEAEQFLDGDLAQWAFEQASDCVLALPNHPDSQSVYLIYHVTFGEADQAIALAGEIAKTVPHSAPVATDIRALLNASNVFERAGLYSRAVSAATHAFCMAREIGLLGEMQRAASSLTYLCRENSDPRGADDWLRIGQECGADAPQGAHMMAYHFGAALRALDEGYISKAKLHLAQWTARYDVPRDTQRWALAEAIRLRVIIGEGAQPTEDEIKSLAQWALRAAPQAPEDDVADAVERSLRAVGRRDDADAFAVRFGQVRRKRSVDQEPGPTS